MEFVCITIEDEMNSRTGMVMEEWCNDKSWLIQKNKARRNFER